MYQLHPAHSNCRAQYAFSPPRIYISLCCRAYFYPLCPVRRPCRCEMDFFAEKSAAADGNGRRLAVISIASTAASFYANRGVGAKRSPRSFLRSSIRQSFPPRSKFGDLYSRERMAPLLSFHKEKRLATRKGKRDDRDTRAHRSNLLECDNKSPRARIHILFFPILYTKYR